MVTELPFSQSCENNKEVILEVLQKHFAKINYILEIGSGTGQHAAHFSANLPHVKWQTTDQQEYLEGIRLRVEHEHRDNLFAPLLLDVNKPWPIERTPAIFSANTVHIMAWREVEKFFATIKAVLDSKGIFCLYGPFNYNGLFTSESNAKFDQWLKGRNLLSGIRDFEKICLLAGKADLQLIEDYTMPANNRLLVWEKN